MLPKLIVFIFFKTGNNCFLFTDQSIFVKTDNNYCNFTDQRNCSNLTIIISILPNKVFLLKLVKIISALPPTKVSLAKADNNYCNFTDQRIIVENDDHFTDHLYF